MTISPYTVTKAIASTHGACGVGTVAARLGADLEDVAHAIVIAIGRNMLVEHPTMPNIYGLPRWYR